MPPGGGSDLTLVFYNGICYEVNTMNYPTIQQNAGRLNAWLLAFLAFALPLSTSGRSILALLILAVWLVEGGYREKLRVITTNPVAMAVLLYLALFGVGLLWTEELTNGLDVIKKYWKIMLLPVFLTAVRWDLRRTVAGFFLAGMTVAVTMTSLAWLGRLFHYADDTMRLFTWVSHSRNIAYNPTLAIAIYLLWHEVAWGRVRGVWRWLLAGLASLMMVNMFITEGRSGQLVFFVLLGLFIVQLFKKNILRAALLMAVVLPLIFALGYQFSPVFHRRMAPIYSQIVQFHNNPNTSVGLRLLFWQNSWEIIKENPWLGAGTGDFQSAYGEVNTRQSPEIKATDNPHNQYILVLCQLGIAGLAALAAIFAAQIRQAFVQRDGWERARLAFPLFFLTIMLTESYLIVSGTGFLFSVLSAVLYAQQQESSPSSGPSA